MTVIPRAMASRITGRQPIGIFPPGGAMPNASASASGASASEPMHAMDPPIPKIS